MFEAESISYAYSGGQFGILSATEASNGSYARLRGWGIGAWLEYTVSGIEPGDYHLVMTMFNHGYAGIYQTSIDGLETGAPVDYYGLSEFADYDYGVVTVNSSGILTIRFTCVGKNSSALEYRVMPDVFTLTAVSPPIDFEFEDLAYTYAGNWVSDTFSWGASGQHYMRFDAAGAGNWIEFQVPGLEAGIYQLSIVALEHGYNGIYQLQVNNVDVGSAVDYYSASSAFVNYEFGSVNINTAGTTLIRFICQGKAESALAYRVAPDLIQLQKIGELSSEASQPLDFYLAEEWENAAIVPDGNWSVEAAEPVSHTILEGTTEHVHSGSRALKSELYNPDGIYSRAEIAHNHKATMGEQYFYRFSVYLPTVNCPVNKQDGASWELITQWHGWPDANESWRSPPLGFYMTQNADLQIQTRYSNLPINDNTNAIIINHQDTNGNAFFPIPKDQWVTFEVSVMWDWTQNGFLDVWMDGDHIVDYVGPTTYNDVIGPYLKMGIYRSAYVTERHTAYYDNLQILRNGVIAFSDRDTTVRNGIYENTNYGADSSLLVKYDLWPDYLRESFLHFNYSQYSNYLFSTGDLMLNMTQATSSDQLNIYRTSDSWSEATLTYASSQSLPIYAFQGAGDVSQVTNLLPVVEAPGLQEISLRLSHDVDMAVSGFFSKESTTRTKRPMMVLRF